MDKQFITLLKNFIESYTLNSQNVTLTEWLASELKTQMPEKSSGEIHAISTRIISSLEIIQSKREELDRSLQNRRSKEAWLTKEIQKSASGMTENEASEYLHEIHSSTLKAQSEIIDAEYINDEERKPFNEFTIAEASRQIENTAVLGTTIEAEGYELAEKYFKENLSTQDKIIDVQSCNDLGIKAAASGAFKTASERGIIPAFPANTPDEIIAGVGFMAVEKVKACVKKLPFFEFIDNIERNAVAVTAVLCASKGAAIGATIGAVFGPAGAAVGGVIGGTIGYAGGAKVGEFCVRKIQEVKKKVVDTVSSYVAPVFRKAANLVKSGVKKLTNWLFG